ncbi:MAG: transketolase, partial [Opitutales bacterium]|nr:transketolase [Opitutales bacterium]
VNFDNIVYGKDDVKISTRMANAQVMQQLAKQDPLLLTGSADLFSSNKNYLTDYSTFSLSDRSGRNIQFGVREHAMGAIANGICYDGYFHPSCATFLVFSDYMRAAIRVAALSNLHSLFLFTHDSIAVGEDGPTHQPVEVVASLRCIPNLYVVRPADREELVGAWQLYYSEKNRPFAFILTRQDIPTLDEISVAERRSGVMRGGYIAKLEKKQLRCIVISCGSELSIALQAAEKFEDVRVVSMPCMERFDEQPLDWKEYVLPTNCRSRVVIEAGISMPWYKYAGIDGEYICVERFGFSGSKDDLFYENGITVENLIQKIGD